LSKNIDHVSDNSEIYPLSESCSASLIGGVAAGCIVVTVALTIIIQLVIKKVSMLRKCKLLYNNSIVLSTV